MRYNSFMSADQNDFERYINDSPDLQQRLLREVRSWVRKAAPNVEEVISYQIPAFRLNNRMLMYMSGWKDHVSIYPIPHASEALLEELKPYIKGKGTLWFGLDKPLPKSIIEKVIKAHILDNETRTNKA